MWAALVVLLLVAQTLLVGFTIRYESTQAQDEVELVAGNAAVGARRELLSAMQALQALGWTEAMPSPESAWRTGAADLLTKRRELKRVEWRDPALVATEAVDSPYLPHLFSHLPRQALGVEAEVACTGARRSAAPMFSRSYFVPLGGGQGLEVIDLCVPVQRRGQALGFLVGSFSLVQVLESAIAAGESRRHEFSFVEGDGTRLTRAGTPRGVGVYVAERVVDLPGTSLQLRADSAVGRPSLIPNLATALVLGLSIGLFSLVLLLARDVRLRAEAESALAEALAFRSAMEDSLPTGLRARDLQGRISYVNPAFRAMVGFSLRELQSPRPPYWPPEFSDEYERRQIARIGGGGRGFSESREGFETVFMRKNGELFPVMIYEAPLVDGQGRHTGWMSAVLDLSAQRRVEEISRQQQDRLQATARLATVGEMASLLSHELNQPLAAISSYASGSLNLLAEAEQGLACPAPGPAANEGSHNAARAARPAAPIEATLPMLRQALERVAEQAERAGRVIKSVHDFVRRREQLHETLPVAVLLEAVMPLARMQARKSGTRIEVDLPDSEGEVDEQPLCVRCDRTMVEQVLLNLARNGMQAMDSGTPVADRVLTLRARQSHARWVTFTVSDTGPGIAPDVAARLFTPFFTTRPEGMGLGFSLCRTVIEQHGGALDFGPNPEGQGTEFRFTLPAPMRPELGETRQT
ncbi:MAG TPA: ATP-binding protein [Rubrivivax sp.]|nr:ATP-binding protein [Rubrivivax sp.]